MAYTVQMSDSVRTYLRTLSGLSRQGRLKLLAGIIGQLRDHGDVLRSEPSRRLGPASPYFRFDYLFSDGGRIWRADCVASDSAAVFGVLQVVFLECKAGS